MRTPIFAAVVVLTTVASVGNVDAAEEAASTATYVTGTVVEAFGTPPETVDGPDADRLLMLNEREIDWSDPRLPSRMAMRTLLDTREGSHPDGGLWPSVETTSFRLEDTDGAWTGVGRGFYVNREWLPTEPTELMGATMVTLTGEEAYAGLSAILLLYVDAQDYGRGSVTFEGLIYEGEPPLEPDPLEPGYVLPD